MGEPALRQFPGTIDEALDKAWLSAALAPISGGAAVERVEVCGRIDKIASMIRIAVRFVGDPAQPFHACLKSFFGWERDPVTLREAHFYREIAPTVGMRVPGFVNAVTDDAGVRAILIMEDLEAAGAQFCSALTQFDLDDTAQSLDQLARLHARAPSPEHFDWLPSRIHAIAAEGYMPIAEVQAKLDDPRGNSLDLRTRDADLLFAGIRQLAAQSDRLPRCVLHGDCHPGNVFRLPAGLGFLDWQLVQRGNWSYDIAYHICSVLSVDAAEREERALLDLYLDAARQHGAHPPDRETAWSLYRRAVVYGFFHWAITRSVGPPIVDIVTARLGAAVMRHDSYRLLGL